MGKYIYQYKDHLGNVRINYTKIPNGSAAALDYNTYYAFGMNHLNPSDISQYDPLGAPYNYKYNGKELQETGIYDYGWRMYMPDIARWNGMDQLSEKFISSSPYAYVMNNPVSFFDPDGRDIRETATGWTFTGNDISLLSGYMGSGGSYSNLTSQLGSFGGNFGSGGISNFWNTFNGGSNFGGVRTNTNNTFSGWTNSAMPTKQFSYQAGQKHENIQGIQWHSKKIGQADKEKELLKNLHTGFDAVEELGGAMEIAGVALIPYTDGASIALTDVGAKISTIGFLGNVSLDVYEENYDMAIFRSIKFGISLGAGKAIDRLAPGVLDNIILKAKYFIYDKLVSPGIQQNYVPGMPPKP